MSKCKPLTRVERISFSSPPSLMRQFDESLRALGYTDRSKALQFAIRNFITDYAWRSGKGTYGAGAILLTFEHHAHKVQDELTEIQHHYRDVIGSTMHIHLDETKCLEIISVKGKLSRIQEMAEKLFKIKGVMQFKLSTVSL